MSFGDNANPLPRTCHAAGFATVDGFGVATWIGQTGFVGDPVALGDGVFTFRTVVPVGNPAGLWQTAIQVTAVAVQTLPSFCVVRVVAGVAPEAFRAEFISIATGLGVDPGGFMVTVTDFG